MRITKVTNLALYELETEIESENKEYKVKEIISYKVIKGALYYRVK